MTRRFSVGVYVRGAYETNTNFVPTTLAAIGIPRVPQTYSNSDPDVRIRNGEMTFEREDLQKLFDKQIAKLFRLIDSQLQSLFQKLPNAHVSHLVLSGGLGNSVYVQSQLRKYYAGTTIPNAQSISVRIAPDPQLAVCKGLVSDRVRKLLTSRSVLGWRCCRASYGTLCKIAYDKKNPDHEGKELVKDPLNGKLYIVQSIAWFVRKGEPVSVDQPIVHRFIKKVSPGDPRRAFPTSVIECSLESGILPDQMTKRECVSTESTITLTSSRYSHSMRNQLRPLRRQRKEVRREEQELLVHEEALLPHRVLRARLDWTSRHTLRAVV
jgi:hypothetical protein